MPTPRLLDDSKNIVGESPLWHPEEGSLYWTDVNGFSIHRYRLQSGEKKCWSFGEPVCALPSPPPLIEYSWHWDRG